MAFSASTSDLAVLLGIDKIDEQRAALVLYLATMRAEGIVAPADLPDAALPYVLEAAKRSYTNPAMATSETVGPYSVQVSPSSVFFTRAERGALRHLVGKGGAFTVDTTPADAGPPAQPWLYTGFYPWDNAR